MDDAKPEGRPPQAEIDPNVIVKFRHVHKWFGDFHVLRDINMVLGRGETHGLPACSFRLFSVYGPMDDPGWLIPFLILQILEGESPPLTEGTQNWDYLHVSDVAAAVCAVASVSEAEGVFNLGSGQPRSVRSIAEAIRDRIAPSRSLRFGEIPYRIDQIMHLEADIGRLQEIVRGCGQ